MNTDRIEKTTVLRVPRSRVWQALSNSKEFGRWFGMELDGEFKPRLILPLSLSYDHRAVDGADGARFLRWVVEALENPILLALEG